MSGVEKGINSNDPDREIRSGADNGENSDFSLPEVKLEKFSNQSQKDLIALKEQLEKLAQEEIISAEDLSGLTEPIKTELNLILESAQFRQEGASVLDYDGNSYVTEVIIDRYLSIIGMDLKRVKLLELITNYLESLKEEGELDQDSYQKLKNKIEKHLETMIKRHGDEDEGKAEQQGSD